MFRPRMLAIAVAGLAAACARQSADPLASTHHPIVNGARDTSTAHQAVVVVSIGRSGMCSGTLIAERAVLTAAHCLESSAANDYEVGFGNDINSSGMRWVQVARAQAHPSYNWRTLTNDLGLLLLAASPPAGVRPIPPLPSRLALTQADVGSEVEFVGFGETSTGDVGLKLTVSDTLDLVCDAAGGCTWNDFPAASGTICYDMKPGGPCNGDSGGPAFVVREGAEYVAGITSYGDQSCAEYGCSTKVDRFESFIQSVLSPAPLGQACTQGFECGSGFCVDHVCCNSACSGKPCQACAVATGAATDGVCAPVDGACDDRDPCTTGDTCSGGFCVGELVTCPPSDSCHRTNQCNRATGQCEAAPKTDGVTCDDGDPCTDFDDCETGVCQGIPKDCPAPNECVAAGSCSPESGQCVFPSKADDTVCETDGHCVKGVCSHSACGCSSPGAAAPALLAVAALATLGPRRRRRAAGAPRTSG